MEVWQTLHQQTQQWIPILKPKLLCLSGILTEGCQIFKKNFWTDNKTLLFTACTASCFIGLTVTKIMTKAFTKKQKFSRTTSTMKGVGICSYGGLEAISLLDGLPIPDVERADEILIKVKSSAIDPIDFKIMSGYNKKLRKSFSKYRQGRDDEFPLILGRECAGIVVDIGDAVTDFKPGDEVWAISPSGHQGYMSQYIVIPNSYVDHKPTNLTFEGAAVIPYSAVIMWHALVNQAKLDPETTKGKRVLIHDGSSEVGLLAIQLVKTWGGHITTTVRRATIPKAIHLGVNDIIVHDIDDFTKELRKRKKFDVIFNTMGSILHDLCKSICNPDGIIISLISSPSATDKYGLFAGIIYSAISYLRNIFDQKIIYGGNMWLSSTEMTAASLRQIRHLIEADKVGPIIDSMWEMNEFAKAFQRAAKSSTCGKVVVKMD